MRSTCGLIERNDLRAAARYLGDAIEQLEQDAELAPTERLERWREVADLAARCRSAADEDLARQRILALLEAARDAGDPELLAAKTDVACARVSLGDHPKAVMLLGEVLAAAAPQAAELGDLLLRARHALGLALFAMDDAEAAAAELEPVLAARVVALAPADALLVRTKLDTALVRRALGDLEGARLLLEDVLARGLATLDRAAEARAQVELAEASAAIGSSEQVREGLARILRNAEYIQRLPSGVELLDRVTTVEARLQDLEALDVGLADGQDALLEARRRSVIASFGRLRPSAAPQPRALGGLPSPPMPLPAEGPLGELVDLPPGATALPGLLADGAGGAGGAVGQQLVALAGAAALARQAGDLLGALGKQRERIDLLERSLPADDPHLFDARLELAWSVWDVDGPAETLRSLDELLEHGKAERPRSDPELLEAQWQLALTKRELGDLEGARALLREVLEIREQSLPRAHPEIHDALAALAWTELELGATYDALVLTNRLLDRMRERVRDSWCRAPREARENARVELGRLAAALSLVDALAPQESLERDVFELLESLRMLSTALPPALSPSTLELTALRREAARVRAELADLCQVDPGDAPPADWSARARTLEAHLDELGRRIHELQPALRVLLARARPNELSTALASDAAAVTFWRHQRTLPRDGEKGQTPRPESCFSAFVVRSGGVFERIDLGAAPGLEALVADYRAALLPARDARGGASAEPHRADASELATALRARLYDPLELWLGGVHELYVCLDDVLHLIPIEALPLDGEAFLGERYAVHHEISLARLLAPAPPAPDGPACLVLCGGIDYDAEPAQSCNPGDVSAPLGGDPAAAAAHLPPLPGTAREIADLAALFADDGRETRVLGGAQATKSALRASVQGARYVHLATHGWSAPESLPSRADEGVLGMRSVVRGFAPLVLCGLALAGANHGRDDLGRVPGILTAEELAGFDLSSAELVVLSACETGLGLRRAGQGVHSLQTALFAAGARSALTSLWKVSDDATAAFMQAFYGALWRDGTTKSAALAAARAELRSRGFPARDWAGWVLSGDAR